MENRNAASNMASFGGALALNNLAIDMVQRRSYEYGMAAFKDAIVFIKASFAAPSALNDEAKIDRALEHARERQLQIRATNQEAAPHLELQQQHDIRVVDDFWTMENIESSMSNASSSRRPTLIRLDTAGTKLHNKPDSPEFESAVILQNMGVAYYCMAKKQNRLPSDSKSLLRASIRLFQLSYHTLMKLMHETKGAVPVVLPELLHVAIVVVTNQVLAMQEGRGDESMADDVHCAQQVLDQLRLAMRHVVEKLENVWLSSSHLAAAA